MGQGRGCGVGASGSVGLSWGGPEGRRPPPRGGRMQNGRRPAVVMRGTEGVRAVEKPSGPKRWGALCRGGCRVTDAGCVDAGARWLLSREVPEKKSGKKWPLEVSQRRPAAVEGKGARYRGIVASGPGCSAQMLLRTHRSLEGGRARRVWRRAPAKKEGGESLWKSLYFIARDTAN